MNWYRDAMPRVSIFQKEFILFGVNGLVQSRDASRLEISQKGFILFGGIDWYRDARHRVCTALVKLMPECVFSPIIHIIAYVICNACVFIVVTNYMIVKTRLPAKFYIMIQGIHFYR